MDTFAKYEKMRDAGADAPAVYEQALADGVDRIAVVRLLRAVFALDLVQAKEAISTAEGATSLSEHQEHLLPAIERAVKDDH